jgi:hypothetical protein
MISQTWEDDIEAMRNRATKSPGFFKPPASLNLKINPLIAAPRPDRTVSGRVFPNGEFGVGFRPPVGISAEDRRYEADRRYAEQNAEIIADIEIDETLPEGFKYTRTKVLSPPLKLGIGAKSSQPRGRYGKKGITGYGRKMVRNAGTVIQHSVEGRYNRKMCMGTVTLPSYSPETMKRICTHWGDIIRVFFQRIRRRYARYRYDFTYTSVSEIQPARYTSTGEVGLHLHFLFVAIRLGRGKWVLPHSVVRQYWEETIKNYLGQGEMSQHPNYRCDIVNKSAAGYLGKYLSKGGDQVKQVLEEQGEEYLPSQWWNMDNRTRKCIHRHTIVSQGAEADMLLSICTHDMKEYYRYKRTVTLATNATDYAKSLNCPEEVVLGYGGLLTPDGCRLFQPPDMSRSIKRFLGRTLDTSCRN